MRSRRIPPQPGACWSILTQREREREGGKQREKGRDPIESKSSPCSLRHCFLILEEAEFVRPLEMCPASGHCASRMSRSSAVLPFVRLRSKVLRGNKHAHDRTVQRWPPTLTQPFAKASFGLDVKRKSSPNILSLGKDHPDPEHTAPKP